MSKIKKALSHVLVTTLLLPVLTLAQTGNSQTGSSITIVNPVAGNPNDLMALIVLILNNIVMPIGAVLCVLWIIYAGFKYVTAQGNEKKVSDAHRTLLWALVGTGILLGAAGISQVIKATVQSVVNY